MRKKSRATNAKAGRGIAVSVDRMVKAADGTETKKTIRMVAEGTRTIRDQRLAAAIDKWLDALEHDRVTRERCEEEIEVAETAEQEADESLQTMLGRQGCAVAYRGLVFTPNAAWNGYPEMPVVILANR